MVLFLHCIDGRAVSNVVGALAVEMLELDVDVTVVTTQIRDRFGWPSSVPTIDLGGDGRRTSWSIPALRRAITRIGPDVVISHTNGSNRAAVIAASTMSRRSRPRIVAVEHVPYSTTSWSLPRLRRHANRLLLPRADRLIGVSPGVVDDLAAAFPGTRSRLVMVPPPLTRWRELRLLASAPVEHPWFSDGRPTVVTVGNINAYKDHRTLIGAIARLRDRRVRLVVIGRPDDPRLLHDLGALTVELGLGERVAFLGYRPDPLAFVARSCVFALSSMSEGLPIAMLEAMACGVPIVSTACPGPTWLLEQGRCGLVVPVGDDRALAEALDRTLTDRELRRCVIAAGKKRVLGFAPRRIAARYLEVAGTDASRDEHPTGDGRSETWV